MVITYLLCSVIETIIVNTTCFAVKKTISLGWNCGYYVLSHLFSNKKQNKNGKFIYLQDVVVQDIKMMDTRSQYIDYNDYSDSDDEYVPTTSKMIHPIINDSIINESTAAWNIDTHEPKSLISKIPTDEESSIENTKANDGDDDIEKQVNIIKDIISGEKYLDIEKDIQSKNELEDYLSKEYDKRVKEEIENEWVNIQVFE
jgi:hypothetical protein